jgi:UDP-2,3-diacylglucosamine pyrophosphatase LpxH
VYVTHGHDFDRVMPQHRWFIVLFRTMHRLRVALGAEAMHVARYAKRFPYLYRVLQDHVALNAIEFARTRGYAGVLCGHTHHAEERTVKGVRYVNTGAWTEHPPHYCVVDDQDMVLEAVPLSHAPATR